MEVGSTLLPRPAFVADLARLAEDHKEVRVLIIVDSNSEAAQRMFQRWTEVFSKADVAVMASDDALRVLPVGGATTTILHDCTGGALSEEARQTLSLLTPPPMLVVTCEPYDAYGVSVKKDLERSLLPLIRLWQATLLVHDANHETLRAYDTQLLRDRLYARPRRIRLYKTVVRLVYAVARLFNTGKRLRWKQR